MKNQKLPIPDDLQERYRGLGSLRKTAKHYGTSHPVVIRWLKEIRVAVGDNAKITKDTFIQPTRTHKAISLRQGVTCNILEVCEDYVKIRLPYMLNHVNVPEDILEKIPVGEDERTD